MGIRKKIEFNGLEFMVTDDYFSVSVILNLEDVRIANAIKERDPAFLAALETMTNDVEEIESVLLFQSSRGMWEQRFENNLKTELGKIKDSKYASVEWRESRNKEYDDL